MASILSDQRLKQISCLLVRRDAAVDSSLIFEIYRHTLKIHEGRQSARPMFTCSFATDCQFVILSVTRSGAELDGHVYVDVYEG